MMLERRRTRLLATRRRGFRLAIGMLIGVTATAALLMGFAQLSSSTEIPVLIDAQPLRVVRNPPPPQEDPPPPKENPPPPQEPVMPVLPSMQTALPQMSTAPSLPILFEGSQDFAVDAVIRFTPPSLEQIGPPTVSPARAARRLFTPDLRRYYPSRLAQRGITGKTVATVHIDANGRVLAIDITESVPSGQFDRAARRALKSLRYEPALNHQGTAIPTQQTETLVWTIQ